MAQVCGDSSFDYIWERLHNAALGLLRKASDSWAILQPDAPTEDAVLAVLYRVYLSEWSEFGGIRKETRDLGTWLSLVRTSREEIETLRPNANPKILSYAQSSIEAELSEARSMWALGNPESPSTEHVLNAIEHILFTHRLTRRPCDPKMPNTVIRSQKP